MISLCIPSCYILCKRNVVKSYKKAYFVGLVYECRFIRTLPGPKIKREWIIQKASRSQELIKTHSSWRSVMSLCVITHWECLNKTHRSSPVTQYNSKQSAPVCYSKHLTLFTANPWYEKMTINSICCRGKGIGTISAGTFCVESLWTSCF